MRDLNKKGERLDWIDVARGIGILLVILGHCMMNPNNSGNRLILSFHMPLFFFLSGFCTRETIANESVGKYIKRKTISLLFPQIILGAIFTVWDVAFSKEGIEEILVNAFTNWFLLVLFWVNLLYFAILKLKIYRKEQWWAWAGISFCMGVVLSTLEFHTMLRFEIVPMGMCFFCIGIGARLIFEHKEKLNYVVDNAIFLLPVLIVVSACNSSVLMYLNEYGNPMLFLISSIVGILIVCSFSKQFGDNKILIWMGRNSIYFYILHFKLLSAIRGILEKVFRQDSLSYIEYPMFWVVFTIAVLILCCVTIVVKKFILHVWDDMMEK